MKYIVLDSNVLFIDYDKNYHIKKLFFSKAIGDLLKMRKEGRYGSNVSILVPEVVLRELVRQRIEDFNRFMNSYAKIYKCIDDCGISKVDIERDNYPEDVIGQINEWMKLNDIKTIPICNKTYFDSIIEDAIEKRPPFEGKDKKSDKGFKDALIFYSLIDFAKKNPGEYILWTQDSLYMGNNTRDNISFFLQETGCEFHVINRLEGLIERERKIQLAHIESLEYMYSNKEYYCGKTPASYIGKITHIQPVILGNYEIVNVINEAIEKAFDEDKYLWEKYILETDADDMEGFFGELEGIVSYNSNGLLGIRLIGRHCFGGVANPEQKGVVYDLNKGCLLNLEDLLMKSSKEIIAAILQKQKEDKEKFPNKYWTDFEPKYNSIDEVNYYIDANGIHIFYETYEASCGADGNVEFILGGIEEFVGTNNK